jgi:hypothetical protein
MLVLLASLMVVLLAVLAGRQLLARRVLVRATVPAHRGRRS